MLGAELVVAHLGADQSVPLHDPQLLAAAYRQIFATGQSTGPTSKGDTEWQ